MRDKSLPPRGPAKILIVDDEEVVRDVCRRSLETCGYELVEAENGSQALHHLERHTFDIIFTDLKMPLVNGVELLEAVKRDHPYSEVIVMTGLATVAEAIETMKKGAHDFVLKPVRPEQIRLTVKKCLERILLDEENRALRVANEKLLELKEMKDKFIAITSHELRTPVSHLKGYLDILLNEEICSQLSDKELAHSKEVLLAAVRELEQIVDRMHALSQTEDAELERKLEPVEVNGLVKRVVLAYEPVVRRRKQRIELHTAATPLDILAIRDQIQEAVSELVRNAIKFTPDGGKVQVRTQRQGDYCVISVKDTGVGIDRTEQGKIFERFYEVQDSRYHTSSKEAFMGGGLGLGLPSARSIAAAHGGDIKVISDRHHGSEFLVYLPLAEHEPRLN